MEREYVGIDFHRRRSVVVRVSAARERLSVVRVDNDPVALAAAVTEAGPSPEVVIEATYGWYWVVDLLQELGATVHLANQGGPAVFEHRRTTGFDRRFQRGIRLTPRRDEQGPADPGRNHVDREVRTACRAPAQGGHEELPGIECALPRAGSLYRRSGRRAGNNNHRHEHGGPRHRYSAWRQSRHAYSALAGRPAGRTPAR